MTSNRSLHGGCALLALSLVACSGAAFDAAAFRRYAPPLGVAAYRQLTLPNGLEATIGRREGLPVVTVGLSLHGGDASADPVGAPHVARSVASASVRMHGDPIALGATLVTTAGTDDYEYVMEGSADRVASLLAILAERVASMEVHDDDLQRFFVGWRPEAERRERWPVGRADREFRARLYVDHPLGRSIGAGLQSTLGAPALQRWIDRTHVPGNASLAVVGEIDPDAVATMIEERFGAWRPRGAAPLIPPLSVPGPAPPTRPAFVIIDEQRTVWARIHFGCLVAPVAEATTAVPDLAAQLATSVLERRLRDDLDTKDDAECAATVRRDSVDLQLTTDVRIESLAKSIARLRSTLSRFAEGDIDVADLDQARWQAASRYRFNHDTTGSLVAAVLDVRNRGASLASIDAYPEALLRPSPADVGAVFARCLSGRPVVSIIGKEPAVSAAITEAWP